MNKRIVLIDETETPDYAKYFGCGLSNIRLITQLEALDEATKAEELNFGHGDGIMVVGAVPFKYLQSKYHMCIRRENYRDCSFLKRLSMEGGAYVKVVLDVPTVAEVNYFMSEEFTKHRSWNLNQGVLKTISESINYINWLSSLPIDTPMGFDYEASGLAMIPDLIVSGMSLSTSDVAAFISFSDIRRVEGEEAMRRDLYPVIANFLLTRQSYLWTVNQQYEFQVSHREFGIDLMNLCDAGVYNVLDGFHLDKKYSLKWTSARVNDSAVWDSEFDYLSGLLDSMYFITEGTTKKDRVKKLKVTPENYKQTDEWRCICNRYPQFVLEFETLISEYWAQPFMNIPSDILGYYCNLDSFYTLQIHLNSKDKFSEVAREIFLDNSRLGARLHSCGMYKDEAYRLEYAKECEKMMAWGITYCASALCSLRMKSFSNNMMKPEKLHHVCRDLIKRGKLFGGDIIEVTKVILSENVDQFDSYPLGLDEGSLVMKYGETFAIELLDIVLEGMLDSKMIIDTKPTKNKPSERRYKQKIDEGVVRKKKLIAFVSARLESVLGLDLSDRKRKSLSNLEEFLRYEAALEEFKSISTTQLTSIDCIPDRVTAFGVDYTLLEYSTFVSKNYFICKSPLENDKIVQEFGGFFKLESAFLTAIFESTQQLPGAEKFYSNLGINNISSGFDHFYKEWEDYYKGTVRNYSYPNKVFDLALVNFQNGLSDAMKNLWTSFDGLTAQTQFFPSGKDQFVSYSEPFQEADITDRFYFMRKFVISYLLYKKYAKVLSTYLEGMFNKTDKWVIEDPTTKIPIREAFPGEPGAVRKMFAKYEVNSKSSKRWSSGYHTIVSHSDIKSTINTPDGYLLTYFDISSAEVKAAGFASGDPDLIDKFVKGIDIYVYTGKLYLPDGPWDTDPGFKNMWRKRFKTIFLGILYGLGKKSLAERLNCSEEEAGRIIEAVYQAFPKLREYVAKQQAYPFANNGCVNTFFGDRLQVQEWDQYNASSGMDKSNLKARIERLGVNLPIQGGTSGAMASGFFNDIRVAKQEGWNLYPIIVVHDSNTNYIPIEKLFEIRKFYDKHFTDFCYESTGIKLQFDLLCGCDYETACEMHQIDDHNIEFSGNAHSLRMILDKVMGYDKINVTCNVPRESIVPNYITHPIDRFIKEKGTSMIMDKSKYKIILTKHD